MRIPRMTTRRWMVVVAVIAPILTLVLPVWRSWYTPSVWKITVSHPYGDQAIFTIDASKPGNAALLRKLEIAEKDSPGTIKAERLSTGSE